MEIDGLARCQRRHAIAQARQKEMEVDPAPRATAPPPHQHQSRHQSQFFADIDQIKAPAVNDLGRMYVLPGNNDEQIKEQPPNHQKSKIQRIHPDGTVVLLYVGLYGQRGHHRNDV